ncbi:unnamed protein product [Amoebophrya sp. A120]|nr:unnamed protein product [Amoebophrya sp. A120]|eukprot:GSA120T00014279001.1
MSPVGYSPSNTKPDAATAPLSRSRPSGDDATAPGDLSRPRPRTHRRTAPQAQRKPCPRARPLYFGTSSLIGKPKPVQRGAGPALVGGLWARQESNSPRGLGQSLPVAKWARAPAFLFSVTNGPRPLVVSAGMATRAGRRLSSRPRGHPPAAAKLVARRQCEFFTFARPEVVVCRASA